MNMSKFVAEDVPLFLSLIEDLFPGLKADRAQFPDISAALEKVGSLSCCLAPVVMVILSVSAESQHHVLLK